MRTGVPCNENRFFPVIIYYTVKTLFWPCTDPVRDCSAIRKQCFLESNLDGLSKLTFLSLSRAFCSANLKQFKMCHSKSFLWSCLLLKILAHTNAYNSFISELSWCSILRTHRPWNPRPDFQCCFRHWFQQLVGAIQTMSHMGNCMQ